MTSLPEQPHGPDLDALREDIDELKQTPTEDLIQPKPGSLDENDPEPEPTDAPGSTDWDERDDEERTDT